MGTFGAVVVGVTTGCLVGTYLIRAVFKRYPAAALVERQVQWNEKALRTILELRVLAERIALALKQDKTALWQSLKMDINSTLIHLQRTLNESVIYAERDLHRQLKNSVTQCRNITEQLTHSVHTGGSTQTANRYESLLKELDRALLALASPLREKLGLDPLHLADIGKNRTVSSATVSRKDTAPPEEPT